MARTHSLATAALAASLLAGGLTAASAQSFTVNGTVSGAAPTFTYSYVVTPTTGTLGLIGFNFSDASVLAGTAPTGFINVAPAGLGSGLFEFLSTTSGGTTTATTFTFTSPDATGGTLGATNLSVASGSSGSAIATATGAAPAAAPEPTQAAAFGLGLLGLSALALKARKRQSVA